VFLNQLLKQTRLDSCEHPSVAYLI
ncbi:MAG: hypothetical protein QOF22_1283, partial [Bradyrhizobium sp.]|nr:hypothetical protein [Bradyrhizobium sp.]